MDGAAASLRAERGVGAGLRALSSQARSSALVIGVAPAAFGAIAALIDSRTAGFLLRTRAGLACLMAGLALDALGGWWMHRIVAAPAGPGGCRCLGSPSCSRARGRPAHRGSQ